MTGDESVTESAKAVQEVAKAGGKVIDAAEMFGGFIAQYIAGPIEQGMGIFEDKLKYMRWERQVRFMQRANQLMHELGLEAPAKAIPLKLALPLLEAASLEDDDYLQDLWARLLVNGAAEGSDVTLKRAYIAILEQLTALDAMLLQKIYSLPYESTRHDGVDITRLPNEVSIPQQGKDDEATSEPSEEVKLALANLARVGCIAIRKSWGGGEIFRVVNPTLLGKNFVEACTLRIDGRQI